MENNLFRQLCGKINYNTYNNIQKALAMSHLGIVYTDDFIVQQYPMLADPLNVIKYTSIVALYLLAFSNGKNYTKDIVQIRNLYQEFLKNYNKLNKTFNLSDPIQIHIMFYYLLYEGYLSKDKNFQFSNKQARDIDYLYGANVITGQGVCGHISTMFTDILNDFGIKSNTLIVYCRNYKQNVTVKIIDKPKYTKEELIDFAKTHIVDEKECSLILEKIEKSVDKYNKNIEISLEMVYEKKLLKSVLGDHVISYAFKDENSYFLDPTNKTTYRMSKSNNHILYDDEYELKISPINSILRLSRYSNNCLLNQYPSVSKEEEKMLIEETVKLCNKNIDIFENFYSENSDLYKDISSKILKIKY